MSGPQVTGRRLAGLVGEDAGVAGAGPRYVRLAEAVRLLVVDGRLAAGTRMPSERELTDALGTSRSTVTRAYEHLRGAGYLVSRRGSGSVLRLPPGTVRSGRSRTGPSVAATGEADIDLTFAALPADPRLAGAHAAALTSLPDHLAGPGVAPLGLLALREAIAERYARRGLPTSPEEIVVTTGAVAGLAAIAHAFLRPGDRALVEHPAYPGALATLRLVGARLVPWAVEGAADVDTGPLAAVVRQAAPRLALLTPDFHNPTGRYLPAADRAAVAEVLASAGVLGVVDETLVDTALDPRHVPAPPFAASSAGALSVGSASKTYWSGLRVGWIRAPREHVGRLLDARAGLDLGAAVLEQLVVADLLRADLDGEDAGPDTPAATARRRRDHLLAQVRRRLPDWEVDAPAGGHSLWCRLPVEASAVLAERCAAAGLLLAPGSAFSVDERGLDRFVRLPYTLDEAAITRAVEILGREWDELRDRPDRRRPTRVVVT